jgi:hypothetical protein
MKSHPSRPQALLRRTLNACLFGVRRSVARAACHAAAWLARLAGLRSDDGPWIDEETYIHYDIGNVGIGTPAPIAQLANTATTDGIAGVNPSGIQWKSTANEWAQVLISSPASGSSYGLRVHSDGTTENDYALGVSSGAGAGAFTMVVRGDGNVGIGTTSPAHKLEVAGDGNFSGALYANGQPCVPSPVFPPCPNPLSGSISPDWLVTADYYGPTVPGWPWAATG